MTYFIYHILASVLLDSLFPDDTRLSQEPIVAPAKVYLIEYLLLLKFQLLSIFCCFLKLK